MTFLSLSLARYRQVLAMGSLLAFVAGVGMPVAPAQTDPSGFSSPYPPTYSGPGVSSPTDPPHQAPVPATGTPPLTPPPSTVNPLRAPSADVPADRPAASTADALPETVTLQDEAVPPPQSEALLRQVLQGSVTKTEELPIDLTAVLRLVEEQSLPVQRDALTAQIQKTAFYRSLSNLLPDIVATYQHSRFQGAIQIFGSQTITIYQTRIQPQLAARWTIYPGGQQVFQALAARRRQRSAESQSEETLQQQLAEAASEYYALVEASVQVQNVEAAIKEVQSLVALNEARERAGVGTRLDVMQARSLLAQQERSLIEARANVQRAEQNLLNTLNLDPTVHLAPRDAAAQPRLLVPITLDSQRLVTLALESHPDLLQNWLETRALRDEARATLGRIVPSVRLETYINGTGPAFDALGLGRFGGILVESNLLENLGTDIPLEYRQRLQQIRQNEVQRQILSRDIESSVINAYLSSRANAQAILTARQALAVAQEAHRLAVGRYRAGLGIYADVLEAETSLISARTELTRSILAFNRSQVDLLRAMGIVSTEHILFGLMAADSSDLSPANPKE